MKICIMTFVFSALLIQMLVVITYFQKKLYLLLNIVFSIVIIMPLFIDMVVGQKTPVEMKFFAQFVMSLFPIYYCLMVQHKYFYKILKNIIFMYILSLMCLVFLFITAKALTLLVISFIAVNMYNLYTSRLIASMRTRIIIIIILVLQIMYNLFSLTQADPFYFILAPGVHVALSFFPILYNVREQVLNIITKIGDTNKRLTHTVTRLKQSNEQTRRIIFEKDLELYQLARHASLAELTAGIAHELAQPLTGIKGIAQNMIDDINYNEFNNIQGIAELAKISSLVDKSTIIIDHIRNFSRKNVFTMKYLDLNKVILEATELVVVQLKKNDIELIVNLNEKISRIYGDKISLEQLLLNIIINAKDAILEKRFDNHTAGAIQITSVQAIDYVKIIIEDNGVGIPSDNIEKIWSPFFTTKKRDYGTGIGLSISNKIIMEHKGTVHVESSDKGTIFTISFPVAN